MNVYQYFDIETKDFSLPFFEPNDIVACRKTKVSMKDNEFADKLQLFKIGTFDEVSGQLRVEEKEEIKWQAATNLSV